MAVWAVTQLYVLAPNGMGLHLTAWAFTPQYGCHQTAWATHPLFLDDDMVPQYKKSV